MVEPSVIFISTNEVHHTSAMIDNVRDIASGILVLGSGSTDDVVELVKGRDAVVLHCDDKQEFLRVD